MALNRPHGKASDIWSAGVLLHILLSGTQPFLGTDESLRYTICSGELHVSGHRKFISRPSSLDPFKTACIFPGQFCSSMLQSGEPLVTTQRIYCSSFCASTKTIVYRFTKLWNTGGSRWILNFSFAFVDVTNAKPALTAWFVFRIETSAPLETTFTSP